VVVVFARSRCSAAAAAPVGIAAAPLPAQNNGAGRTCCVACVGGFCVCVYVLSTRVRTHKHTHVSHPHAHRCCCLSFALPLYHPLLSPNLPKTPNSPPLPPFACQSVSASRFVFYYSRPAYTKMATAPNSHTNSHMSIEYW